MIKFEPYDNIGEDGLQWVMAYKTRNLGYFEDSFQGHVH